MPTAYSATRAHPQLEASLGSRSLRPSCQSPGRAPTPPACPCGQRVFIFQRQLRPSARIVVSPFPRATRALQARAALVQVMVEVVALDFVETRQSCATQRAQLLAKYHRYRALLPSRCWRAKISVCRANSRRIAAVQASIGAIAVAVVWCAAGVWVCWLFCGVKRYAAGFKYSFDRLVPSKTVED